MKKELFELLPKPKENTKTTESEAKIVEEFFKNNEVLRKAINFESEGIYSISNDLLKTLNCPIKRKNGKSYWEAFFFVLGFEYYKEPRNGKIKLIVR